MPLTLTGAAGEYLAGSRCCARQSPSALHPTIEMHAPLRYDIIEVTSATSIGCATYHWVHRGGRAHNNPPLTAREAGRRAASREYPYTLDLRRVVPGARTSGAGS